MKKYPLLSLVLANLVPVIGILFLGWDLFSVMFFYWLESAVIGIYNLPKMLMAQVSEEKDPDAPRVTAIFTSTKITAVIFFILHYGGFMLGHGFVIFAFFGPVEISPLNVLLGVASLTISHGVSFKTNFIDQREYEKVNLSQQMFAPYPRIIILHLSIFAVAFLVALAGSTQIALIILVAVKIVIDLRAHIKEHIRLGTYLNRGLFRMKAVQDDSGEQDVKQISDSGKPAGKIKIVHILLPAVFILTGLLFLLLSTIFYAGMSQYLSGVQSGLNTPDFWNLSFVLAFVRVIFIIVGSFLLLFGITLPLFSKRLFP
jgi:hypothetical protein